MIESEVGEEHSGLRLDQFLASGMGSRAAAQRAIADGRVTVDGEARNKRWLVSAGEVVRVVAAAAEAPTPLEVADEIPIVHEDERFLVVDKPAGLVAHPAPGHPTGTLSQAIASRFPGRDVGLVHRLDRDTSGLLIVALDEEALRTLRESLQVRDIVREYAALCVGHPRTAEGTVDAPIGRDRHARTRMSIRTDTPREAITHFEVVETFADSSLLRVRLETGRTHQIRVHLAEIGLPVAGDPVYGRVGLWGLRRQFLHAQRLVLPHPFTGETIELRSELPVDLNLALERARAGERV